VKARRSFSPSKYEKGLDGFWISFKLLDQALTVQELWVERKDYYYYYITNEMNVIHHEYCGC
jgi:hypothetical protein